MKKLIYILPILMLFSACREGFDFEYPEVEEGNIVIEGYLTNEAGEHKIRVSETTRLGNFNGIEPRYVEDAIVRIEDDQGSFYSLNHRSRGEYFTNDNAVAEDGRSYKVVVELTDGRIFESEQEILPEGNVTPIDLKYELGARQILVNGTIQTEEVLNLTTTLNKESTNRYYLWEVNEYFIKEADSGPGNELEDELELPDTVPLRFCYVRDFPIPDIYVHKDIANDQQTGRAYEHYIQSVYVDSRWEHDYILMVRQLQTDSDAFAYWEEIGEFSQNSGSLFDPFPSTINGNIKQQNGSEKSLGYFGVYKTTFFRQRIRYIDLGISDMQFFPCTPPQRPGPHPCRDCRLSAFPDNFYNNKPDWWD